MLDIQIKRVLDSDTQVACYVDGRVTVDFFSYDLSWSDEAIRIDVKSKLTGMGYVLE